MAICNPMPHGIDEDLNIVTVPSLVPEDETVRRILRERAVALAAETNVGEASTDSLEIVEFTLGTERYGVISSYIREVCPVRYISQVPSAPSFVFGLINLRGEIVSVVDLRRLLSLPVSEPTNQSKIVVLHNDEMEFGILADSVSGIRSLQPSELQSGLPTLTDVHARYLMGITEDRLAVLDAEAILSDEQLVVHENV